MTLSAVADARVLVVDDDANNRMLIELLLDLLGVGRVLLEDGRRDLLDVVAELDPHLVFLDLHVGEHDGFELLASLAERDPGWTRRRVVLVTGETGGDVRDRALALGAVDVVTKPFDTEEFTALVERLLLAQGPVAQRAPAVAVPASAAAQPADLDYRAVFDALPVPMALLDPGLRVVGVNDAFVRASRASREELVGRALFDAFPENPADGGEGERNLRTSLERVVRDRAPDTMALQKWDLQLPDGSYEPHWWSPVNLPVLDARGGLQYVLHRVEEVTDFMVHQERTAAMEEREGELEREVYLRSREIQQANRKLEAANAAKSEFLSRVSHELRTPLTSILGFGELLSLSEQAPQQREWAHSVMSAGRHLLAIINEVLDISRIESGHLALSVEPVPVEQLVRDVLELARPLAAARDVELRTGTLRGGKGYVLADNQRLRQVLLNLVSNGIKYNHAGGAVDIAVAERGPRLRVLVSDTGPGLSDEQLGRLFRPFERLGATGVEGTGLGLVLSRELAEAMGGELGVTSTPGEGSTFWVELDQAEPVAFTTSDADETALVEVRRYSAARSVLYVEDLVANVTLVEQILRHRPDVTVLPAMLGGMALDLAKEHAPDLVLLDLHLPDIGGDEVLARLKGDPATRDIPVVVFSADATRRQTEELVAAGAQDYLTKPIRVADLLAAVDAVLEP